MHARACMLESMRTTIELDDRVREALVKRAAERGEKGYSKIINEVLVEYLGIEPAERAERLRRAEGIRRLSGSISEEFAARLYDSVRESREHWRTGS